METFRKFKNYFIAQGIVEYSEMSITSTQLGYKDCAVLSVLVDKSDGERVGAFLDQKVADTLTELQAKNPGRHYEKELMWPADFFDYRLWRLVTKRIYDCKYAGRTLISYNVPIFTATSDTDTCVERGEHQEIPPGSVVEVAFWPEVVVNQEPDDVFVVDVILNLEAVKIIKEEPRIAPCYDKSEKNAADFGL